jgi:GntR family transcriptional regulator
MTTEQPNNQWHSPLPESDPAPLWFRIAHRLRDAIERGEFEPGDVLPSETKLNEVFSVSRATSRSALNNLESDGLIVRRAGRGSIVLRKRIDQPAKAVSGFSEDMRRRGLEPSYETLEADTLYAPSEITDALELDSKTRVFRSSRRLLADGALIGIAESWISPPILKGNAPPTVEVLDSTSLYVWLNDSCNVQICRAHQFIEAALASKSTAVLLGTNAGAPILIVRRTSYDSEGKPIEFVVLRFRADSYRFELDAVIDETDKDVGR